MATRSEGREEHGQNRSVGPEPNRRRGRSRVRAGYRRDRGLHENLRPGQANRVPSEQRQFFATARDQERAGSQDIELAVISQWVSRRRV